MSLSESLTQYEHLKADISELELPKVYSANLTVKTEVVSVRQLVIVIETFSATQGWVQYSDELVISAQAPSKPNILEAQYCNAKNDSLHVKLQQGDSYLLTSFLVEETKAEKQFYTEQQLIIRNNLKEQATTASYRLWWQLESEGVNEGRWLPLAQQFLGFDALNNKEVQ
ncbi:hypothetical protein [Colwellia sp. 12G3]|uniref:hypothetical protein n=1 Tax=Colwellia sp. 12G3 TaxID=2058299 RepID=UPI000C333210|nr:hypothetical protein [Colwellia sp. 12G3]PKI12732.1 hypothetical protein CXF71_18530 [Colwellia sp. 12G3]